MELTLPYNYNLREYQIPLWDYFADGGKRAVAVWHRRAGKDITALHRTVVEAHKRVGTYWHMLPLQNQARKVIWDGIVYNERNEAVRVLDWAIPKELRKSTHSQEMKVTMLNGSVWQLCGSDNYDALVGSNPVGVVMSEYSVAKPSAWDYIRPILAENNGWALFIYTPRGRNHGGRLYDMACNNPDWFAQILTVEDTQAIPMEAVEEERNAGMIDEMIQQEFFCSFEGVMVGSYFGPLVTAAQQEGRICRVPHDPIMPVYTSWDLGIADTTAIWFWQLLPHAGEVRVIDFYENSGEGLAHYAQVLGEKPYVYAEHYAPHDIMIRELGTGRSRFEVAESLGIEFRVVPAMPPEDRIQASRNLIPRCWFDHDKCQDGIDALREYRREFDETLHAFKSRPLHDWASHAADSFGHFAVGYDGEFVSYQELADQDAWREEHRNDTSGRDRVGGY